MNNLVLAFVKRRPVRVGPMLTPGMRNVRPTENITPSQLPDPIRQSDFVNQGKAFGAARMPIAIASHPFNMVQEDEFGRHPILEAAAPHSEVPYGAQLPFKERTNIAKRSASAYGSLVTMNPQTYDYSLFFARTAI